MAWIGNTGLGAAADGAVPARSGGGAYDVWWQQILALKDDYRVISVTY
jgi:hypothetical protein